MTVVYAVITVAILLVAGFTALVALIKHVRQLAKQMTAVYIEVERLKKEQIEALKGSYGMGQRMLRLEKRFKVLADMPHPEPQDDTPFSYSQAVQMIQQGAGVEAVAATCGLSHSEAHLMRKLCAEGLAEHDFQ